jgi:hypothetical protein
MIIALEVIVGWMLASLLIAAGWHYALVYGRGGVERDC